MSGAAGHGPVDGGGWKGIAAAVTEILGRFPAAGHPDAALIAMAVEHVALSARKWPEGAPNGVMVAHYDRIVGLERRMARFRAATPEGVLIKLRLAWADIGPGRDPHTGQMYTEALLVRESMRDLRRMTG